jgi:hypothetical protein
METGPNDELATVDAYGEEQPTGQPSDPSGESGGWNSWGNRAAKAAYGAMDRMDEVGDKLSDPEGTGERVTSTLWESLLCGSVDPDPASASANRARLGRTALWLRSTGCGADDLIGLLSTQGGRTGVNQEELRRRLEGAANGTLDVLKEEEMDTLVAKLVELTGEDPGVIQAGVDGAQSTVQANRRSEVSGLNGLLSQYTGAPELIEQFDLQAEVALLDTIVSKAVDLGVPAAYQAVMDSIADDRVKTQVALRNLRLAALRSDLSTINAIVDQTGRAAALAKEPSLVTDILRYYSWGSGVSRKEYPSKRDELLNTLDRLDSNWARKQRGGRWVDNLEPFSVASSQALTLLEQSSYQLQAMMAPSYSPANYRTVVRKYHPFAAIA